MLCPAVLQVNSTFGESGQRHLRRPTPIVNDMSKRVWVFGEIQGLNWVVDNSTMAFSTLSPRLSTIEPGDEAILYTSRGAFHNPTRDVARLVGLAEVTGTMRVGEDIEIAGRDFAFFVPIKVTLLLPERTGPSVREFAPLLKVVKRKKVWGQYFRSSPIAVEDSDFSLMKTALDNWVETQ
jgi:hypothetical protein